MMQFKQSPVVFDESAHTYHLGEKRLLGITGLIHQILGLGVYPEADDYTKDFIIPRAGSRGTAVHHAIQTYDELGIMQSMQTVHARYGSKDRGNIQYRDDEWDVTPELSGYISHLEHFGFRPLANELTVSDNAKWASQIDNVWQYIETGGIWLVDTKTNNTDLYPRCGYFFKDYFSTGVEALKEYLSWQLSIYAVLFESENPGLKVEGLACNWLKKDRSDFWVIERKPDDLVRELLTSDYIFTDNGPVCFHHDQSVFGIGKNLPDRKEDKLAVPEDVVRYMSNLLTTVRQAEKALDEAKQGLRAAMIRHDIRKADFGTFTATLGADTTVNSFDTKKFREDNPELYNKYVTSSSKKGSFTIKLKDK